MSENGENPQPQQAPQVQMKILGQYVRDLSFENVMAQRGASGEIQPDVNVQVNLDAKKRQAEDQYEVILKLKVESKAKGMSDVLFLLEIEYVGIFFIQGVPEDQLHPFLLIECPRILFPFVRRIVADVTRDGGYPSVNLEMVDFMALYRQQIAQRAQQQAAAAPQGQLPQ